MADYPERESHFAHTTFRLMSKVCAAQDIGSDAMLLVAVILHQEDAKWYKSAVTFYNGQLAPILGFTNWNRLNKARQSAVDAGWLHYEPGGKRKPGIYWGMIPQHAADVDDSPIDEGSPSTSIVEYEGVNSDENLIGAVSTSESGGTSGEEVEGQPGRNRGASGEPPTLNLKPKPKPKKERARATRKFVKPTLDEVGSYCRERKNSIDPEQFIDHYESNGWKVGKNAMKNWKATVRTWEKNGMPNSGKQSASGNRSAIDAWAIAVKLAGYQSKYAQDEPDRWDRLREECPADVREFAKDFGLQSILGGKIEIVRGQFTKLWNDSS